jgi:Ni/Co efflux regulator RcnB
VPYIHYVVLHDYYDYFLPPPPYGHYYVRYGSDIYLIAAATRLIVDAFLLLDAARYY